MYKYIYINICIKKAWDKAIETRDADIAEAKAEPGGIKVQLRNIEIYVNVYIYRERERDG